VPAISAPTGGPTSPGRIHIVASNAITRGSQPVGIGLGHGAERQRVETASPGALQELADEQDGHGGRQSGHHEAADEGEQHGRQGGAGPESGRRASPAIGIAARVARLEP
jgi:hypothetical protein